MMREKMDYDLCTARPYSVVRNSLHMVQDCCDFRIQQGYVDEEAW